MKVSNGPEEGTRKRGPKTSTYGLERKVNKKSALLLPKTPLEREVRRVIDDMINRVEEKDYETQEFYQKIEQFKRMQEE